MLTIVAIGLFLTACSSGNDGGSVSGSGSSTVEGNVSSITMAMLPPLDNKEYSLAGFLKSLLPVQSAYADSTVEGVQVGIGSLGTTTNSSGYFRIDGVPPGTHEIVFSKNNQTARTSVGVGENEIITMRNVRMQGSQARVENVEHQPMGGTPGTPQN